MVEKEFSPDFTRLLCEDERFLRINLSLTKFANEVSNLNGYIRRGKEGPLGD